MSGGYREVAPRPDLAAQVACLWAFEGGDGAVQRIAPDGCCELIVHLGAPYQERCPDGAWIAQPKALFAGQLTRPLHLRAPPGAHVISLRFTPAGASAFAQSPLDQLTDRRMALADVTGPTFAKTVQAVGAAPDPLAALETVVEDRLATGAAWRDAAVEACVARLTADAGWAGLETLAALAGLSPRQLERRFARTVGVSPRRLASILRFRRLFDAIERTGAAGWSAAAQDAGYFDHPQMARDFRRFVGCTPSQFLAGGDGLAGSLAGLGA